MSIKAILSNRKILVGLGVVAIVAAILIGGTIAYFSDTETSVGNTFVAGKLDLKIDNTCHYNGKDCVNGKWGNTQESCACTWEMKDLNNELYFSLLDVKPGDTGEDTVSLHVINNDAWMCAEIKNLANNDNGCENPETKAGDTTCGPNQGELLNTLLFSIWKDNGAGAHACNNFLDTDETPIIINQTAQAGIWPIADSSNGGIPLPGGTTLCYGISWTLPLATDNKVQGDSLSGDVLFSAVQSRHMANYICGQENGGGEVTECVLDADCNDRLYCNGVEICSAEGICLPGGGNPCPGPDGDIDCSESCNETNNDCSAFDPNGSSCLGGTCQSGTCIPSGPLMLSFTCTSNAQCNDGNACTDDVCTAGSCSHSTNSRHDSCNDGDNCTTMDTCQTDGTCLGINVSWLYDTSSCTFESCDSVIGYNVIKQPVGSACTDTYLCTLGQGTCNNTGSCNSGGACLASTPTGCTAGAQCNDSNLCTNDSCSNNSCSHIAVNCDDGNALTVDTCDSSSGCIHVPCTIYYYDYDGDGYGTDAASCLFAPTLTYRATQAGDCNDGNGLINPAMAEVCGNFVDDNCNGQTDEGICFTLPVSPNTPSGGCTTNADCDDSDYDTVDSCVNGDCVNYEPLTPTFIIPGLCTMDVQCDDSNAATIDQCNNGECVNYQPFTMPSFGVKFCFFGGCACWGNSCN